MTRRTALSLIPAAAVLGAADKKKKPKPPEITIVEVRGQREAGVIAFDGKVKNTGERPADGVLLKFDFLDTSKVPLTTQKGSIDDETLDPGEECEFRFQVDAPPRSVFFRIEAYGSNGMDIRTSRGGPFPIQ
jgi:hypothetical protein